MINKLGEFPVSTNLGKTSGTNGLATFIDFYGGWLIPDPFQRLPFIDKARETMYQRQQRKTLAATPPDPEQNPSTTSRSPVFGSICVERIFKIIIIGKVFLYLFGYVWGPETPPYHLVSNLQSRKYQNAPESNCMKLPLADSVWISRSSSTFHFLQCQVGPTNEEPGGNGTRDCLFVAHHL